MCSSSFKVHDLSRLVDRLPWRIERALQHKCYSLLTGEDIELFPDLAAAAAARSGDNFSNKDAGNRLIQNNVF